MIRRPPRSTLSSSSAASDVYKRQINGLTDLLHPCQVLADLMTIQEHKGRLAGLKLAYIGDGNNMVHSLMFGGAKMGLHVVIASPPGYKPDPLMVAMAQADAKENGG